MDVGVQTIHGKQPWPGGTVMKGGRCCTEADPYLSTCARGDVGRAKPSGGSVKWRQVAEREWEKTCFGARHLPAPQVNHYR